MRLTVFSFALALVLACTAAAAEGLTVSLTSSPLTAVGSTWTANVAVRRGGGAVRGARVVLVARRGQETVTARARHLRAGRYSARLRLGSAGSWRLAARVGRTTRRLGTVTVGQGPFRVREPFGIVVGAETDACSSPTGPRSDCCGSTLRAAGSTP